MSIQAKPKFKVARRNCAEHRVQADVLPHSVSRHFSAQKTLSVSLAGSRGNTQLTQTVRHLASNLFAVELVLKLAFRFYNLGRSSQQSCFGSVYSRLAFQSFLHQVWLFPQVFNQALFKNSWLISSF